VQPHLCCDAARVLGGAEVTAEAASRRAQARALVGELEAEVRACWVTHAPVGLVEQPPSQTRRVAWAMKNST
jgi:hypothetical protein